MTVPLLGLRKSDVDLERRTITVARSYDGETTKGGHTDTIPLAAPVLPFLRAAIERSKCELVFPTDDGEMHERGLKLSGILRRALGKAQIVEGYDHCCRRCLARTGKPRIERHADGQRRRCDACGMVLWAKAVPRPMRFHDLRHTTATLLWREGIDPHRVQRLLWHSDVRTTTGTYGHLEVETAEPPLTRFLSFRRSNSTRPRRPGFLPAFYPRRKPLRRPARRT